MQERDIVGHISEIIDNRTACVCNNKLLNKFRKDFTWFEKQLFIDNFYYYNLNYDKNIDFVVDYDNIWKWLGIQQKVKAVALLEKHFTLDIDYKIFSDNINVDFVCGVLTSETILLTMNCYKLLCLRAHTTKTGNKIYEYYMKMEEVLHKIVKEEEEDTMITLEQKDNIILEIKQTTEQEKQRAVEQSIIIRFPLNTECIYFGTIDITNEENEKLIKFGHTNDLETKIQHNRKKYNGFVLVEAFRIKNKVKIEYLIKTYPKIKRQIRTIQLNGKKQTEIIAYNSNSFTIEKLTKHMKDIIHSKTYSLILMEQNEELENENRILKETNMSQGIIITEKNIEINELREKLENNTHLTVQPTKSAS